MAPGDAHGKSVTFGEARKVGEVVDSSDESESDNPLTSSMSQQQGDLPSSFMEEMSGVTLEPENPQPGEEPDTEKRVAGGEGGKSALDTATVESTGSTLITVDLEVGVQLGTEKSSETASEAPSVVREPKDVTGRNKSTKKRQVNKWDI